MRRAPFNTASSPAAGVAGRRMTAHIETHMAHRLAAAEVRRPASSDELQAAPAVRPPWRPKVAPSGMGAPARDACGADGRALPQFYSFLHELEKAKATLDNA